METGLTQGLWLVSVQRSKMELPPQTHCEFVFTVPISLPSTTGTVYIFILYQGSEMQGCLTAKAEVWAGTEAQVG